ncbi:MAG: hypothetical protein HPY45_14850 [Anaerolineae bacterium]|nr:hypothetical protein [Anaerolineae bacterium]
MGFEDEFYVSEFSEKWDVILWLFARGWQPDDWEDDDVKFLYDPRDGKRTWWTEAFVTQWVREERAGQ